jgi:hypothetical protein
MLGVAAAMCGSGLVACGGCGGEMNAQVADAAIAEPANEAAAVAFRRRPRGVERADAAPSAPDAAAAPDAAPSAPDAAAAPDAGPFGANCGQDDECDSNTCADFHCTIACEPDDPHACRGVLGLCALVRNIRHACIGDVASGSDADDVLLRPTSPSAIASFATPGDADVVRLAVPAGSWRVVATPAADADLALDFYDARARLLGISDGGGVSAAESATWTATDELGAFVVLRHVGGAPGAYSVSLSSFAAVQP